MSQRAHEQQDLKHTPASTPKQPEPPIGGVSPDEPFPIIPDGTGKPGQSEK